MKVLITGGTGLIGKRLTQMLQEKGYEVAWLSRSKKEGKVRFFQWDLKKNFIESDALTYPDYIINLAGANVFEKKWTKEFKQEIISSRTSSVELILKGLKENNHQLKAFISASAIGYYGADTGEKPITEEESPGKDFLASVVTQWEERIRKMESLGIRTVWLRIGIVLSSEGGALEKLLAPIKMGAGSVLGSGKQYVSWIHIDDVCRMFLKAIEDADMKGAYNAVAPEPVTNEKLTKDIAFAANRSIYLPNVPAMALKFMLGSEKAAILLGGNNIKADKIQKEGFKFEFPDLQRALKNLIR